MRTTWLLELLKVTEINRDVRVGGFTPENLLGQNVPSLPILASVIRLVVWADFCSETGSVVCWVLGVFPGPEGSLGLSSAVSLMAGPWPKLGGTALSAMYVALGGPICIPPWLPNSFPQSNQCYWSPVYPFRAILCRQKTEWGYKIFQQHN